MKPAPPGKGRETVLGRSLWYASLRRALLTVLPFANVGCSLAFTQAPEPDIHPPPPCNTYLTSPVADTILASASVGLMAYGVAVAATSCNGSHDCFAPLFGGGAIIAGALAGAVFTTSAVVGYQRTAGCRALEESKEAPPPAPSMPSAWLLDGSTPGGWASQRDTPRRCPSAALRR